jgi:hypothetical protein
MNRSRDIPAVIPVLVQSSNLRLGDMEIFETQRNDIFDYNNKIYKYL